MKRVAVEANLSNVQEYLSRQGYQVETLGQANGNNAEQAQYDAIVISGVDENVMGMQDIVQNCPVISANGLTEEQIYQRLEQLPR
ncbi:YkuS family protein [Thermoflavimicrobium dichotomicum]|uniref:Uncharacterized protein family (UPF0180) n=1 Tax=Thermoflavimicrobium dichotomicum TaxID=46223 RepID=A0A1I3LTF7_9BACL|nr:YkuS family protein [Thermoflavimicrobium dichotomicum]SFI88058.1 Uncharacterised protein family (UPF0180) [Thermoflavimicrobium dichotomicum]